VRKPDSNSRGNTQNVTPGPYKEVGKTKIHRNIKRGGGGGDGGEGAEGLQIKEKNGEGGRESGVIKKAFPP